MCVCLTLTFPFHLFDIVTTCLNPFALPGPTYHMIIYKANINIHQRSSVVNLLWDLPSESQTNSRTQTIQNTQKKDGSRIQDLPDLSLFSAIPSSSKTLGKPAGATSARKEASHQAPQVETLWTECHMAATSPTTERPSRPRRSWSRSSHLRSPWACVVKGDQKGVFFFPLVCVCVGKTEHDMPGQGVLFTPPLRVSVVQEAEAATNPTLGYSCMV